MAGGALRIVNSFTSSLPDARLLAQIYFITDLLLLVGLIGLYLNQRKSIGALGLTGFVVAVGGIGVIRCAWLIGPNGYQLGASLLVVGLVVMGIPMLTRRTLSRWVPLSFVASLAFGLGTFVPSLATAALALAGVTFGVGFMLAGAHLWAQDYGSSRMPASSR